VDIFPNNVTYYPVPQKVLPERMIGKKEPYCQKVTDMLYFT